MRKVLKLTAVFLVILSLSGCSAAESEMIIKGEVEAPVLSVHSEVQGKIVKLPIELGQQVNSGDVIAVIDNTDLLNEIEQLEDTRAKKQLTLAELCAAADPEQIKQCENNIVISQQAVSNANTTQVQARDNYERNAALYREGAISQAALDDAAYKLDTATNAVNTAKAQLDNAAQQLSLTMSGASKEKIDYAKADIAQTENLIKQAREKLDKYTVKAVKGGTIVSKNYLLGDMVASGYNLADISVTNEEYIVAYLPKDKLSQVSYGQEITVKADRKQYNGNVCFVDVNAEYTPKDMQTKANKDKENVKIKVSLGGDTGLKPGQRAELALSK